MAPKLTKDSEAVKTLISWFKNGRLSRKDKPSDVYKAHDVFKPYKPETFRTRFINPRKQYCNSEKQNNNEEDDELDRRCSLRENTGSRKRRFVESGVESDDDGEEDAGSGTGIELVSGDLSFKPLSLLSVWKEPHTMTKRVSVAIVLPSGGGVGGFSLRAVDSGEFLELTVVWPSPLLHMEMMHKKWLGNKRDGIELYQPKVVGFQLSLSHLRSKTLENVQSVARISLPFRVQTSIDNKYNLAWGNSTTRMLYVDLKAVVEDYAIVNDSQAFEVL